MWLPWLQDREGWARARSQREQWAGVTRRPDTRAGFVLAEMRGLFLSLGRWVEDRAWGPEQWPDHSGSSCNNSAQCVVMVWRVVVGVEWYEMFTCWIFSYSLDMQIGCGVGGKKEGSQYDCEIWGWKGDTAIYWGGGDWGGEAREGRAGILFRQVKLCLVEFHE